MSQTFSGINCIGNATIGSKLTVNGNLEVKGTTTGIDSTVINIGDSSIYLNAKNTTLTSTTAGVVVNYGTVTTVTTSTAFTATSVAVASVTGLAVGDIIQVSGANDVRNNGLFEIKSISSLVLTIKGSGDSPNSFSQTAMFVATDTGASVVKVSVSNIRSGTTGDWEIGKGSSGALTYSTILTGATNIFVRLAGVSGGQVVNGGTTSGDSLTLQGSTTLSTGGVIVASTGASTSSTTGALTVAGGLGVAGAVFAGTSLNAPTVSGSAGLVVRAASDTTGVVSVPGTTASTSSTTGAVTIAGGLGVAGAAFAGTSVNAPTMSGTGGNLVVRAASDTTGVVSVPGTTASTSSTTGAVTMAGGLGVAGAVFAGTSLNGPIVSGSAGLTVRAASDLTGTVTVPGTDATTDETTGALVVAGGVGVGGKLYVLSDVTTEGKVLADTVNALTADVGIVIGGNLTDGAVDISTAAVQTRVNGRLSVAKTLRLAATVVTASATPAAISDIPSSVIVFNGSGIVYQLPTPNGAVNDGVMLNFLNVSANSVTIQTLSSTGIDASVSSFTLANQYDRARLMYVSSTGVDSWFVV